MKIKGPALYKKIRRDNILPLPSLSTLQRYIQQLQPSYGFQESVFKMIKEKAKYIPNFEKHGIYIF